MKRFLWLGSVLFFYLICSGCGDTFRPIIIPNPPTFPNPAAAHTVVSINDNAPNSGVTEAAVGSAMVIDVSGDSNVSEVNVGLAPVHAVQQTANEVLVVNHSVTGATADSLTKLNFNGTVIGSTTTISLPPNSEPNFVAVAPNDTTAYVSLPNYMDPIKNVVVPSVAAISTLGNNQTAIITVGNQPVALAVTPDKSKLYVANQGDRTISGFNTMGYSQRGGSPVSTSSPPIWLLARSDNQRVYVLEQDGTLAWLDTTSTVGDTFTETTISVPGATTMLYDSNKNRLYITGGTQMTIVDVSQSAPQLIKAVTVPPFAVLPVGSSVPAIATAVAALPDGSRAYVASYAVLESQFSISAVSGDGTTATYAYSLTAGHDLTPGATATVTGTGSGFDGTFLVEAIVSGTQACPGICFQTSNLTNDNGTPGAGVGSNIFPQVSVVDVNSNTIASTIGIPGFPDATVAGSLYSVPVCATTRFRFMMAAGGDSTRAYLSSCDGGGVNIIDTSNDTYVENLPAPIGVRTPIQPSLLNPPQNPMFLIAGP
jgi:DNA-binding beta-propeller fold protein YncE